MNASLRLAFYPESSNTAVLCLLSISHLWRSSWAAKLLWVMFVIDSYPIITTVIITIYMMMSMYYFTAYLGHPLFFCMSWPTHTLICCQSMGEKAFRTVLFYMNRRRCAGFSDSSTGSSPHFCSPHTLTVLSRIIVTNMA